MKYLQNIVLQQEVSAVFCPPKDNLFCILKDMNRNDLIEYHPKTIRNRHEEFNLVEIISSEIKSLNLHEGKTNSPAA